MKSTALIAAIALLAAAGSASSLAAGPGAERAPDRQQASAVRTAADVYDHGMQPVANHADPKQRAHGWRYFSDPAKHRAVVISPDGNYYLSRGKGLRWVAAAPSDT